MGLESHRREIVKGDALPIHDLAPMVEQLFALANGVAMTYFTAEEIQQAATKLPPDERDRYIEKARWESAFIEQAKKVVSQLLIIKHLLVAVGLAEHVPLAITQLLDRAFGGSSRRRKLERA